MLMKLRIHVDIHIIARVARDVVLLEGLISKYHSVF